jgi:hypothetical protein
LTDENYTIVSNMRDGEPIDRIYGGGALRLRLIQKDGTEYTGTITKKSIIVEGQNGNFKSHVYVTDDKRVFDNSGMPVYNYIVEEIDEPEPMENNDATQDKSDV